jgi:flavin reductase (DIM6/NTAB) family NADH-FMN oxidoreductase RutF
MAVGDDLFKQCLRRWASGVTIVTSRLGDEIHGMTVSAFSSVSAEPPLVLVCANKRSKTHAMISSGEIFNVHVLAADQQELSNRFASQSLEGSRFESVAWREGKLGAPILEGALAVLECKLVSTHEEGSHTIYVGHVEHAEVGDSEPLVYYQGGYRAISG